MPEIKIKDQKKNFKLLTSPGNSLSQTEFLDGIQKAEEGPFNNVQESMKIFEQWLKLKEKKLESPISSPVCNEGKPQSSRVFVANEK